MVMPRLTEEGSRPTLEELGVPDRRAGAAAPDTQGEAEAAGSGGAEAPHTRLRKVQKVGKMLWPGADRRPAGEAEEARQLRRERLEDEYGEDLVDWLDIIGNGAPARNCVQFVHILPGCLLSTNRLTP